MPDAERQGMDALPARAVVVDALAACAVAYAIRLGTGAVFFVALAVMLAAGHMRLLFRVCPGLSGFAPIFR
jgi:hypothetical protein